MTEEHNEELGKICSHCGEKQPLNEFRKRSGRRTGAHVRRGLCRACRQRLSAERLAAARASAVGSEGQEARQADPAASMGRKAGQHDVAVAAANDQAPQGEITEAQTMAVVPRRDESAVEADAQALWTDHQAHAEVAAAVEIPEASRAEAALSGEPDKKRKRRRRRKKAVAQPGGELKLAGGEGEDSSKAADDHGKVAGGGGKSKATGDGEAAVAAAEAVIAMRADAGVDADAGAGSGTGAIAGESADASAGSGLGEQAIAADSGEKPKRKRKKAKRKKTSPAKVAETAEWVDEAEGPQAEAGVAAEVDHISASVEEQQGSASAADQAADESESAGKAKRKRRRSKRKGKSKEDGTSTLSPEGEGVGGHAQAADVVGVVQDSAQVVTGDAEVARGIGKVVQVSALSAPVDEADVDLPLNGEQQEQPGKKRKRKRKKKPNAKQSMAGVDAQPSVARVVTEQAVVGVEASSLSENTEVEGKASSTRTKKPKKTKKAAEAQGLSEAKAAQVKEPVKPVTVAAVKTEEPVKTEKPKSAARANPLIPPPGYKPIWPDKGATSANLLSLRSVLQEQDNVVRTVGQARIEEIADLVEELRKSAELIKREADAFHHTPLRSNRPAKHSNALTRREMQAMREAKLTDHRSRFINHAELVERSKRQQAEGKPTTTGQSVKPVAGVAADVDVNPGKAKQTKFEPFDYSVLRPTGKGVIRMRGRTDKGRRWYQEIEYDMAVTLVREQSAVVVNRQTINRLYSNRDFRSYILTRDNYTCYFCGEYGDTIDHLLPRAKGGHSTPLNCVCACNLCNQSKADKDLDVFLKHQKGGSKR